MIETLRWLGILTVAAFRERRDLALENLALRQQLGVVCRHNSVRQQIQAVKVGAGVYFYAINPNS